MDSSYVRRMREHVREMNELSDNKFVIALREGVYPPSFMVHADMADGMPMFYTVTAHYVLHGMNVVDTAGFEVSSLFGDTKIMDVLGDAESLEGAVSIISWHMAAASGEYACV